MDQGNIPAASPAPGPGPIQEVDWRTWRVVAAIATSVCAPLVAYNWAMPHDAGSLGPDLERLVTHQVPIWGAVLILFAWRGHFRAGLVLVLTLLLAPLAGMVPEAGAEYVGWPGGWGCGVAGFVVGAAYSWLSVWFMWLGRRLIVAKECEHGCKRLTLLASGSFSTVSCCLWLIVFVALGFLIPVMIAKVFFSLAAALFFLLLLGCLLKRLHAQKQ